MQRFEFEQPKLGTLFRIVLYAEDAQVAERASRAAFLRVDQLDAILSDYRLDSELARLSALTHEPGEMGVGSWEVTVSEDLFRVLRYSQDLAGRTGGAFDVTVGPYVRLWRRSRRRCELPSQSQVARAAASVGHEKLVLDRSSRSARLIVAGMRLDLGGVAKGYILDEAMVVLKSHGIKRALIDCGGDVLASSPPPDRDAWTVRIEQDASAGVNTVSVGFQLVNSALATSGDAYQFVDIDGVRYSHIVDPRTGLGLIGSRSVTVHATSAMDADASASAACVIGLGNAPVRGQRISDSRVCLVGECMVCATAGTKPMRQTYQ